ncbi:MAG: aminotransferase class I/II-fold pyridoxal phosphate-dependent enzyme [Anaerotruncus rubiinfantis]|uniref:aminotransferase class I/II-fold pyridoxal phosphate-dependent enzyme n=1 Tax=Anaerotruncus rubiinfantis TaxID=1720200 RepID=UPI001FAC01D9|nr:aminotransferase class I/II-fold pyridoxal phosphate-dependent enzyme [Anaerotruncus rubiinfantis]
MIDYNKVLSRRAVELKPSGIRKFFDIAAEMKDVISLGVGEPDFKTPWSIRHAGIESLERGHTFYTANAGMAALKEEIAHYLNRRFALDYCPKDEVIVTVGGSEGIDLCIRALVNPGDEVLVVEPSFVCYTPITELTCGVPVPIQTHAKDHFRLTAEQLRAAITPKTKLLILPYPNNPTGGVMRREHLEEIAGVLRQTDIMVLSDEIYAELTYGPKRHISFASIDGMKERTIVVNGFSKSYAMTGWRLGYVAGPKPVISQMLKIHQYAVMCAPTTSQYAAIEALRNCDEDIENMREQYDMRRRLVVDGFNRLGLSCFEPEGAFYVFPSIRSTGLSSGDFCMQLLEEERLAVVPGDAFGSCGEGFIRVSYSYSINHLLEALKRIEHFMGRFHEGLYV